VERIRLISVNPHRDLVTHPHHLLDYALRPLEVKRRRARMTLGQVNLVRFDVLVRVLTVAALVQPNLLALHQMVLDRVCVDFFEANAAYGELGELRVAPNVPDELAKVGERFDTIPVRSVVSVDRV
jgi:hypothetical protein